MLPLRRIALRRSKDCTASGTLVPGFKQAAFKRAGSVECCDPSTRAAFKRMTFRRVGEVHSCATACPETFFGPQTFNETDTTIVHNLFNPPLLKSIPVDFSALPSTPYGLRVVFDGGEMQVDESLDAFLWILVGTHPTAFEGYDVWDWAAASQFDALVWTPISQLMLATADELGYYPHDFTNPNPAGLGYIKIFASSTTTHVATGIRNFTVSVQAPSDPLWGPTTFNETNTTTAHAVSVVKEIPVDFSALPIDFDRLRLIIKAGQVQCDAGFGDLQIQIGGTSGNPDGLVIWENFPPPVWTNFKTFDEGVDVGGPDYFAHILDFTNPGGASFIKLCAEGDVATPTGFRNYTLELRAGRTDCGLCSEGSTEWSDSFPGNDIATNPPSKFIQIVRVIPVDGTQLCPDALALRWEFLGGNINYGDLGGVAIMIGLDPADPFEGHLAYDSNTNPTAPAWLAIDTRPNEAFGTGPVFTNPNPTGTFYIKLECTPGEVALFAGLQDWSARIVVAT